ncbi:hypothetical protein P280DRAFT_525497 [Massarina eburnea CBS 473.64]|uniref:Uncharacterized protein n=1 Tax=Massarina eburnea CBS 473.64 TaxID=1395130 RepID=A0A6A6SI50_9PLEO|nr:hypothetical protein P280DRAFT_525497 [Massarina eburnea CBS 473.64]
MGVAVPHKQPAAALAQQLPPSQTSPIPKVEDMFFARLPAEMRLAVYKHMEDELPPRGNGRAYAGLALSCKKAYVEFRAASIEGFQRHLSTILANFKTATGFDIAVTPDFLIAKPMTKALNDMSVKDLLECEITFEINVSAIVMHDEDYALTVMGLLRPVLNCWVGRVVFLFTGMGHDVPNVPKFVSFGHTYMESLRSMISGHDHTSGERIHASHITIAWDLRHRSLAGPQILLRGGAKTLSTITPKPGNEHQTPGRAKDGAIQSGKFQDKEKDVMHMYFVHCCGPRDVGQTGLCHGDHWVAKEGHDTDLYNRPGNGKIKKVEYRDARAFGPKDGVMMRLYGDHAGLIQYTAAHEFTIWCSYTARDICTSDALSSLLGGLSLQKEIGLSSPVPVPAGSRAGVRSYARTSREYRTKGKNKGRDKSSSFILSYSSIYSRDLPHDMESLVENREPRAGNQGQGIEGRQRLLSIFATLHYVFCYFVLNGEVTPE